MRKPGSKQDARSTRSLRFARLRRKAQMSEHVFGDRVARKHVKLLVPKTIVEDARKVASEEGVSFSDWASIALSKAVVEHDHVEEGRDLHELRDRPRSIYGGSESIEQTDAQD